MQKQLLIPLLFLIWGPSLTAQSQVLDNYIQQALESNLALQQQELSYEKSLAVLEEAKGMFFPSLSFDARYSVARGGRTFDIPIGDLMNPVYSNLNLLNSVNSQNPDYPGIATYPKIDNQSINFLRETEHETKLRLVFPVYNAAIIYNNRIKEDLSRVEKISVAIYKKELIKEVKLAYFNYLKASEALKLYENTKILVNENLRTTNSLYKNHKVTIDLVYSAEAQVKEVEQQAAVAFKNQQVAKAFFNFLLNRDYDENIEQVAVTGLQKSATSLEAARKNALQNREEFTQLSHYQSLTDNNFKLQKGNMLPKVNFVADYGFQGTSYSFDSKADFAMGSLVMSWNLFDKSNKAKVQQVEIEKHILQYKIVETRQQIGLQVVTAFYELESTQKSIELAKAEVLSAKKAYQLVAKKFAQGQANLVELTNARTQQTTAEQKLIIANFDYLSKQAEFERVAAL